ncbi:Heparinase II/III family protein [Beutenbergia cavernae DSM 12333]|uniref:Heparinase II/III family protein n=1 Tax=Beutenbergia cavernae (strain ATCC BAA-8 / DSM 12333 / CCUG 43141 / JCM 11478 / NBRC 16432 / NCIMB 13614 / HKI 0122) TaxID=471853 RepID=C5C208_BEUC1|nr:heparinase II/III family protein [Beutenbergia cavernae]ACQ81633.1 Heparinase II/III family protein [Beutenbergia cavernae DSM 12333]
MWTRGGFTPQAPASVVELVRTEHPRLIADDGRLAEIRGWVSSRAGAAALQERLVAGADALLDERTTTYEFTNGRSLLWPARQVKTRVWLLALAYRLTGTGAYAERAAVELEAAAAFPDWNPESFLSTAELLNGFAIGYDWLHGYLGEERRSRIATAMLDKGLSPALAAYENGAGWTSATNNWQIVCVGGVAMASLALADVDPELTETLLHLGLAHVGPAIDEYAPSGGFPEGVVYWKYATKYLVQYIASLESATGSDFGISDAPGLAETAGFGIHMAGPTGLSFNFADASPAQGGLPELYWMADRYGHPEYAWWADEGLAVADPAVAMVWYGLSARATPAAAGLAPDAVYDDVGVVLSRSAWGSTDGLFAGFRLGDNASSHGDLDMGSFVLDAGGVRWARDLGAESYSLPGYFGSERWTYYRKRPEGHNTLVVNPDATPGQRVDGVGTLVASGSSPEASFAVADLSQACTDQGVTRWQRGIAMVDGRSRVVVQDELTATSPVEPWWFMHTGADVTVDADGHGATLTRDGRTMRASLLDAPPGARFSVMDAVPLPTSPNPDGQTSNDGVRKLLITSDPTARFRLSVLLEPLQTGHPAPSPTVKDLADWSAPMTRDGSGA